jgi:ABC-type Mn2+/Zn2+ transport system ATPase subunit
VNEPIITLDNLAIGYDGQAGAVRHFAGDCARQFHRAARRERHRQIHVAQDAAWLAAARQRENPIGSQRRETPVFGYVPQAIQFDPLYPLTGFDVALMGTFGASGRCNFRRGRKKDLSANACTPRRRMSLPAENSASLSGGQKQRVLIARALATKPDILVLDEPTAGVDVAATNSLLEFISQIHAERKLTVLLVTHDLPLVRKHAQQIIWLHNGAVLHGTVAELFTPERMAEIFEMEVG